MATRGAQQPRERVQGVDFVMTSELLKAAAHLIVPEDQTQRKAFEQLMPHLYVLRHKGCSWAQLAGLLAEGGFKLQPSTVRNYFGEMVQTHMEACRESLTEQVLLLGEIRKQTAGADMSLIKGRVATAMENQRAAAAAKIDAMFKVGAAAPPAAVRREPASPARGTATANAGAGRSPAPQERGPASPALEKQQQHPDTQADENDESDHFGLLGPSTAPSPTEKTSAFFSFDNDAPMIPDLSVRSGGGKKSAAASPHEEKQHQNINVTCVAVQAGVKLLSKRPGVDEAVYEDGQMEHPAVPGVMLSMEQRLSNLPLEFLDSESGEIKLETAEEKRFRVKWEKPVPVTQTTTAASFTPMNMALFKKQ